MLLGQPRERRRRDDAGLHLRLVALAVRRKPREQHVGDDEAEHGVAEELERLVVDDAARRVLVRARSMRQRVLEQAEVAELVADALLERPERLAEPAHFGGGGLVEVAGDQLAGPRRRRRSARVTRNSAWPNRIGNSDGDSADDDARLDVVRVEQPADDFRLDRRVRAEDFDRHGRRAAVGLPSPQAARRSGPSIFSTTIVMSSCGSASPTKARTSRSTRSRMPAASRCVMARDDPRERRVAEELAVRVHRLGDAVGVEHDHVARRRWAACAPRAAASKRSLAPGSRRPSTMPDGHDHLAPAAGRRR